MNTTSTYNVWYTHPPSPGITHDFESQSPVSIIDGDEELNPSTKVSGSFSPSKNNENSNTLVCARRLGPLLVLGGSNLFEGERSPRRLWGLRCGRVLDGKCINELMKPRQCGLHAIERDEHGRSNYGMYAVNPSRVGKTFDVAVLHQHHPQMKENVS